MRTNRKSLCAGLLTAMLVWLIGVVASAEDIEDFDGEQVYPVTMEINQSYYLNVGYQIGRVAIANPKIADVRVLGATDISIIALDNGSTSLTIWTKSGAMLEYLVTVVPTDKAMAKYIEKEIGLPGVHVEKVDERIMLRGVVRNQKEMERAVMIATMFLKSAQTVSGEGSDTSNKNIINLLEMASPVQINLEALVLDISTANTSNFGFQYANASGFSSNDAGGYDITFGSEGIFNGGQNYHHFGKTFLPVDVQVQALVQKGLAKVLSRPHITTLSGETAEIMIGGSIALPTTNNDGAISVEWKDYGIKLHVEPKLDRDNKITSKIETEVSTLDYDHAVTSNVGTFPAMTKRTANAVINVESGMTMVIGGLLNSQDGKTIKKIPLLGDIPIIGEFFKHTSKTKDKRELMILIKPRIVEDGEPVPMSKDLESYYNESKKFADSRKDVDLNASEEGAINSNEGIVKSDGGIVKSASFGTVSEESMVNNNEVPMLETSNSLDLPPMVDVADDPDKVSEEMANRTDELEDEELEDTAAPVDSEERVNSEEGTENVTDDAKSTEDKSDKQKDLMLVVADKLSELNDIIRKAAEQDDSR